MTEADAGLPEETLKRIDEEREKASQAEIRDIEALLAAQLDGLLDERRKLLADRKAAIELESSRLSEKLITDLQAFEDETLGLLAAAAENRRAERLRAQEEKKVERLKTEDENARRSADEAEAQRKKAAEVKADPAVRVRTLLKQINGHLERNNLDAASRLLTEALELDAFNAELIDIDAKIREARESDSFNVPAPDPVSAKKSDRKAEKKEKGTARGKKEKAAPSAPAAPAGGPAPSPRKKFPSWILSAVASLLIAVVAIMAYVEYSPRHLTDPMTVAVLPWTVRGDQPAVRVYADALPEIVLRLLARQDDQLDLLGYSTTSNLSRISANPVAALTSLGYSHFLRGQLSGTDSMYSLHVELTDSAGSTLWSDDFTRNAAGIVLAPLEIAHGLNRHFGVSPTDARVSMEVKDAGAYFLYLRGLESLQRPMGVNLDEAINSFSRSLALDSTSGQCHAGLAWALVDKYLEAGAGDQSLLGIAAASAADAIRLAPSDAEGYIAMGRILLEGGRYEDALANLDSASRMSPRDSRIPFLRGQTYFRSGRYAQATDLLRKAYRLDPRNREVLTQLATLYQVEKSFDKALWYLETAMYFSPDSTADLAGPISDVIILDPALTLNQGSRVTSACLGILEKDPQDYPTLYSLARMLQVSGDVGESVKYFNSLEGVLRSMVRSKTADTRARMFLGLTLTRMGRYEEGLAIGVATAAAVPASVEAKYLLARIYSLQMYSAQTKTVDEEKKTKALDLLREALHLHFDNAELGSADLYNVYYQADIRTALAATPGEVQ